FEIIAYVMSVILSDSEESVNYVYAARQILRYRSE
ncbi:MAG: hypothetical protein JWQ79_2338, partial [Mucilaginibacter sp.]|nr:hypothetical protein [Mucilaginibacter sp.]